MASLVPVTFYPDAQTVWVAEGTTVFDAARRAGLPFVSQCGGRAICGGCAVRVVHGELAAPDPTEVAGLLRAPGGLRLACRAEVSGPVGVRPVSAVRKVAAQALSVAWTEGALVAGVDLGTTNVVALLADAASGREVAIASAPNRQGTWGSDVLSRLSAALEGHGEELRAAAEASIVEALDAALSSAGTNADSLRTVAIVGNTVMSALLLGLDVGSLGTSPFLTPYEAAATPRFSTQALDRVQSLRTALVLPPIAGFVGGDALAAAHATGVLDSTAVRLLIDVGTNAEVVCGSAGGVFAASAPAGPAFEGWGVASGGIAGEGAVDAVRVTDGRVRFEHVGPNATHFSGAGLVSALSALRVAGCLEADGTITDACPIASLAVVADVRTLELSSAGGQALTLSQRDVRSLQLAKAAVRTSTDMVLEAAGAPADEVTEVLIAGAFGRALDIDAATRIGLLPAALAPRARAVGNAAVRGALAAALDPSVVPGLEGAARRAMHVDLAASPSFQQRLLAALALES